MAIGSNTLPYVEFHRWQLSTGVGGRGQTPSSGCWRHGGATVVVVRPNVEVTGSQRRHGLDEASHCGPPLDVRLTARLGMAQ